MSEEEFKKALKKTGIISCIFIVIMILLVYTVFHKSKIELTMNDMQDGIIVESIGIKEDLLKQYLSVFGLLVNDAYEQEKDVKEIENTRALDMAISYMNTMYDYIETKNNATMEEYDATEIHDIIQEVQGTYIEKNIISHKYAYNEIDNAYTIVDGEQFINGCCTNIQDIQKKDDKITITYDCIFPNENELRQYTAGETISIETYTIKVILVENNEYDYSKYFVNHIEKVSQQSVQYN